MLSGPLVFMTALIDPEPIIQRRHQRRRSLPQLESFISDCRYSIIQNGRRSTVFYQFLLICIILQDVDLTETNTRSKTFLELQNFPPPPPPPPPSPPSSSPSPSPSPSPSFSSPSSLPSSASELYRDKVAVTRVRRHPPGREPNFAASNDAGQRFKTSPTRIRFSSAKQSTSLERFLRDPQQQQTIGDVKIEQVPQLINHKTQSPVRRQMAPAYEYYWPNDQQANQVIIDRQKISHYQRPTETEPIEETLDNTDNEQEPLNEAPEDLRSSRMRNLIPRPMRGSASSERARRVSSYNRSTRRDLRPGRSRKNPRKIKREGGASDLAEDEVEMTIDVENGMKDGPSDRDAGGSSTAAKGYQIERATEVEADDVPSEDEQLSVNLKVVNDDSVEERSDKPKKMNYSPVYPPGDLDILYSDALLVYVKDFNHFIKR